MLINNTDISTFNATLMLKDIQTADVVIYDDWLRNALNPLFMGKQEQYKQIKMQLFIDDATDEQALTDISNLIKQSEKCTVKFDDIDFYYDCLITSKNHIRLTKGKYTLDVQLKSGFAYKDAVTEPMVNVTSKVINVSGNTSIPAILTLTASNDTISVTLTGFGDNITVKNLKANTSVIIDGESCTVLQGGANKFNDTDMWQFPVLQPGSNTITLDNSNCTLQIQYKPRWI